MASCHDCVHVEVCRFKDLSAPLSDSYIRESECIEKCCGDFKDHFRFVELPCAEWIEDENMYGEPIFRCSNCDERFVLEEGTPLDNCYFYCPYCGAKMDEQDMNERGTDE